MAWLRGIIDGSNTSRRFVGGPGSGLIGSIPTGIGDVGAIPSFDVAASLGDTGPFTGDANADLTAAVQAAIGDLGGSGFTGDAFGDLSTSLGGTSFGDLYGGFPLGVVNLPGVPDIGAIAPQFSGEAGADLTTALGGVTNLADVLGTIEGETVESTPWWQGLVTSLADAAVPFGGTLLENVLPAPGEETRVTGGSLIPEVQTTGQGSVADSLAYGTPIPTTPGEFVPFGGSPPALPSSVFEALGATTYFPSDAGGAPIPPINPFAPVAPGSPISGAPNPTGGAVAGGGGTPGGGFGSLGGRQSNLYPQNIQQFAPGSYMAQAMALAGQPQSGNPPPQTGYFPPNLGNVLPGGSTGMVPGLPQFVGWAPPRQVT